jgi:hypothetical protein
MRNQMLHLLTYYCHCNVPYNGGNCEDQVALPPIHLHKTDTSDLLQKQERIA